MPFRLYTAIVLGLIALVCLFVKRSYARRIKAENAVQDAKATEQVPTKRQFLPSDDSSSNANRLFMMNVMHWVTIGSAIVSVLLVLSSSYTQVSTKEFGVVTEFGRPVGTLKNGLHLILPWRKVTEIDAAIQTDNHVLNEKDCITVRIAHQATACVDTSIRWRIQDGAADALFQDYRGFANIQDSLVTRDLNAALNAAFEKYDPLAIDKDGNSTAPTLASIATKVTSDIQSQIGTQINVLSVIIPVAHFDDSTQSKVNALLAQVAQSRIAEQAITTADNQAQANGKLAASVSKDPNVLVSKCLDIIETGKVTIPAGFSCWPGSSSAVVVPSVGAAAK